MAGAQSVSHRRWSTGRRPAILVGLLLSIAAAVQLGSPTTVRAATPVPTFVVGDATPGAPVPTTFTGFSIDPGQICSIVALAASDPGFSQLFKTLGHGTLRVGGNTGDTYATWSTTQAASCTWNQVVMTPALVSSFFSFAQSVGYQVAWQVPLNNGAPAMDAAEAAYVSTQPGVTSVEIGNEPNFYKTALSDPTAEGQAWSTVDHDYLADGGTAPVTGPSLGLPYTTYESQFLASHHAALSAVTGHYYTPSNDTTNPGTCTTLLDLSTLGPELVQQVADAASYGLPFLINETNSFYSQGVPGVSNAYCSALWSADYSMLAMEDGVAGVDFHGVDNTPSGNTKGLAQYYSPINSNGAPAPEYYGLLFAAQMTAGGTDLLPVSVPADESTVDVYALLAPGGQLRVALFNRGANAQTVGVKTSGSYRKTGALTLTAPSLASLSGTTLGHSAVGKNGTWTPISQSMSEVTVVGRVAKVTVPADSALMVTLAPVG